MISFAFDPLLIGNESDEESENGQASNIDDVTKPSNEHVKEEDYHYEYDDEGNSPTELTSHGAVSSTGANYSNEWLTEYYMKKKWIAKEAELRSRREHDKNLKSASIPATSASSSSSSSSRPKCELFSPEASSKVLTNDLLELIRESVELGYTVTPVDDDIYTWNIKISRIHPDSLLAVDLLMLDDSYG
jgi:hypothetical protein